MSQWTYSEFFQKKVYFRKYFRVLPYSCARNNESGVNSIRFCCMAQFHTFIWNDETMPTQFNTLKEWTFNNKLVVFESLFLTVDAFFCIGITIMRKVVSDYKIRPNISRTQPVWRYSKPLQSYGGICSCELVSQHWSQKMFYIHKAHKKH